MEPAPVMRYHLEFLASRLAWSRLLPGLALIAVGVSQPFATVEVGDDLRSSLSLSTVVARSDSFTNGTIASVFAVLLGIAVLVLAAQALSALAGRTERSRQVTVGLGVLVLILGLVTVVAVGALEPVSSSGDSGEDPLVKLTAQGPIPLLLGAAAVWVAAARAKRPERFLERTVRI